jgi:hypothetical protein
MSDGYCGEAVKSGEYLKEALSVSYVRGAYPFVALHKTTCCIGPGRHGTSENTYSTHSDE